MTCHLGFMQIKTQIHQEYMNIKRTRLHFLHYLRIRFVINPTRNKLPIQILQK